MIKIYNTAKKSYNTAEKLKKYTKRRYVPLKRA
jgi:hypothetical protein